MTSKSSTVLKLSKAKHVTGLYISINIKESCVSDTFYNSRTADRLGWKSVGR